ncbi:MAG: SdpI family protein [Bacteroidota bacterium]
MGKFKFADLLAVAISVVPYIVWFILRDSLPEKVPTHWGIDGEVNGWTDRDQLPLMLALVTAVGLVTYILLRFIKHLDPKRNAQLNENTAIKIGIGALVLITGINLLVLIPKGNGFDMTTIIFVMVSLLFTFLGNLMYNIKPNYFIGIRLPWTLENEDNWKQTHRLAGIVWFVGGIICTILALVLAPKMMFTVFISATILLVAIPGVYSFMLFKQQRT